MDKLKTSILFAFAIFIFNSSVCQSNQNATTKDSVELLTKPRIKDITDNPGKYIQEKVEIEGVVTQYVEGNTATTSYYSLQGNYGGLIKVNTSASSPITLSRYKVTGTIILDQKTRRPVLIEDTRVPLSGMPKILTYGLLVAGVLLILVLVIFILRNRKPALKGSEANTQPITKTNVPDSSGTPKSSVADEDYATIKISTGAPPTMVLVPGRLEIIAGTDKGKSFKIAGYPGPEGSVVTIGREEVHGEKKFAHIQLMEKTVSRKQAEIIHTNKTLYVKNLSTTNQTEIDGKPISTGEQVELLAGSVIKTGEVEFKYTQ